MARRGSQTAGCGGYPGKVHTAFEIHLESCVLNVTKLIGRGIRMMPRPSSTTNERSESLTAAPDKADDATVTLEHSRLSWPTPFELNFMTGVSPSWKRHTYQRLTWIKPNGPRLEMVWHYEQFYYRGSGWASPTMTVAGKTGLIRVDITNPEQ